MNFVFISPHFPKHYWNFCDRLKKNGVNVLGIGDAPFDSLREELKNALTEYYYLPSLDDYDSVLRAVAYLEFKHGKIDWLESNNEYWLDESAKKFIEIVKYPVIVKPDIGVGACDTYKLSNDEDLKNFFDKKISVPYVMEEFITGDICSYDAILDSNSEPLLESMTVWPPSVMDIVLQKLDLSYYTVANAPDELKKVGRAAAKSFGVKGRFVHLEFFRLTQAKEGLGNIGDFVGLEVNMRPAGGYTPDMINFAHSTDVYKIWADMVTTDKRIISDSGEHCFVVYASQRDCFEYVHSHEKIFERYGAKIVMCERMPEMMVPQMGNQMYTAKLANQEEVNEFIKFVTERRK